MHFLQPTSLQIAKIKGHHGHNINVPCLQAKANAEQIHKINGRQQHNHTVTTVVIHHPQRRRTREFTRLLPVTIIERLYQG